MNTLIRSIFVFQISLALFFSNILLSQDVSDNLSLKYGDYYCPNTGEWFLSSASNNDFFVFEHKTGILIKIKKEGYNVNSNQEFNQQVLTYINNLGRNQEFVELRKQYIPIRVFAQKGTHYLKVKSKLNGSTKFVLHPEVNKKMFQIEIIEKKTGNEPSDETIRFLSLLSLQPISAEDLADINTIEKNKSSDIDMSDAERNDLSSFKKVKSPYPNKKPEKQSSDNQKDVTLSDKNKDEKENETGIQDNHEKILTDKNDNKDLPKKETTVSSDDITSNYDDNPKVSRGNLLSSETIPPDGGMIAYGDIKITFPKGTFTESVKCYLYDTEGKKDGEKIYDITFDNDNIKQNENALVEIQYTTGKNPELISVLHEESPSVWQKIPFIYDEKSGKLTYEINHFSKTGSQEKKKDWAIYLFNAKRQLYHEVRQNLSNTPKAFEIYKKGIENLWTARIRLSEQIKNGTVEVYPVTDDEYFTDIKTKEEIKYGTGYEFSNQGQQIQYYCAEFAPWGIELTKDLLFSELFKDASFDVKILPFYADDSPKLFFDIVLNSPDKVPQFGKETEGRHSWQYLDRTERMIFKDHFKQPDNLILSRNELVRFYSPAIYDFNSNDLVKWGVSLESWGAAVMGLITVGTVASGGAVPSGLILAKTGYDIASPFIDMFYYNPEIKEPAIKENLQWGVAIATGKEAAEGAADLLILETPGITNRKSVVLTLTKMMAERWLATNQDNYYDQVRKAGNDYGYKSLTGFIKNDYVPQPPIFLIANVFGELITPTKKCPVGEDCYKTTGLAQIIYNLNYQSIKARKNENYLYEAFDSRLTEPLELSFWSNIPDRNMKPGVIYDQKWNYVQNNFVEYDHIFHIQDNIPLFQEITLKVSKKKLEEWATQSQLSIDQLLKKLKPTVIPGVKSPVYKKLSLFSSFPQDVILDDFKTEESNSEMTFIFPILNQKEDKSYDDARSELSEKGDTKPPVYINYGPYVTHYRINLEMPVSGAKSKTLIGTYNASYIFGEPDLERVADTQKKTFTDISGGKLDEEKLEGFISVNVSEQPPNPYSEPNAVVTEVIISYNIAEIAKSINGTTDSNGDYRFTQIPFGVPVKIQVPKYNQSTEVICTLEKPNAHVSMGRHIKVTHIVSTKRDDEIKQNK